MLSRIFLIFSSQLLCKAPKAGITSESPGAPPLAEQAQPCSEAGGAPQLNVIPPYLFVYGTFPLTYPAVMN